MTNVPIYVAMITAAAGIIGAAIPQVTTLIRDVRQAERDRRERSTGAIRDACIELLRAGGELHILVASLSNYRGDTSGMRARVDQVRSQAEATRLYAASVGLQAPDSLTGPAEKMAIAASGLADEVVRNTDVDQGVTVGNPYTSELSDCINNFRDEARKYFRSLTLDENFRAYGRRAVARPLDGKPEALDR